MLAVLPRIFREAAGKDMTEHRTGVIHPCADAVGTVWHA